MLQKSEQVIIATLIMILTYIYRSAWLAAYLFTNLASAKFLAQHLNARATYVNQIPMHLLVGPAAPSTPLEIPMYHKYSVEMFSTRRPQYLQPQMGILSLGDNRLEKSDVAMRKIQREAMEPLPLTGQPLGKAIGFFEQGILLGLGTFLTILIPSVSYGSWIVGKHAWRLAFSQK